MLNKIKATKKKWKAIKEANEKDQHWTRQRINKRWIKQKKLTDQAKS
ncbi:hypothetical protein HYD48_03815 [Mycoplasmopsis bovis]|nr:hypothetical protein [Mycoplasmopsis bovis]QQH77829.1 hypothetical protein HYD48_03815 [Mycoplasmopsis bovis]